MLPNLLFLFTNQLLSDKVQWINDVFSLSNFAFNKSSKLNKKLSQKFVSLPKEKKTLFYLPRHCPSPSLAVFTFLGDEASYKMNRRKDTTREKTMPNVFFLFLLLCLLPIRTSYAFNFASSYSFPSSLSCFPF